MKWFWVVAFAPFVVAFWLVENVSNGFSEAADWWEKHLDKPPYG